MAKKNSSLTNNNPALRLITLTAIFILMGAGVAWWKMIYSSPSRTFWGAIDNSLSTHSVIRKSTQKSGGEIQSDSYQLVTKPSNLTHGYAQAIQLSGQNSLQNFSEGIGLSNTDYIKYTTLTDTSAKVNYAPLLNIWTVSDPSVSGGYGRQYSQIVLGAVLLGNLSDAQKGQIMQLAKQAYKFNTDPVKKEIENGRPTYTYAVKLNQQNYAKMLVKFGQFTGLKSLSSIDPGAFADQQDVDIKISVDVWSRQIRGITYVSSGRSETYSGYNALVQPIAIPNTKTTIQDLQSKLQTR